MKNIIFLKSICLITIIHSASAMDSALPLARTSGRASRPQEFHKKKFGYINELFEACDKQDWDKVKGLIKTKEESLLLQSNSRGQFPLYQIALWDVGTDEVKQNKKKELIQEYCARFGNDAHTLFEHVAHSQITENTENTLWHHIAYNGCPIATQAAIIALLLKAPDKSFMIHKAGWLIKQTPLHAMVLKNNLQAAQMLLEAAGDDAITLISEPDSCGNSAFTLAFHEGRVHMLHLFYPYIAQNYFIYVQDYITWIKSQFADSLTRMKDMYSVFN